MTPDIPRKEVFRYLGYQGVEPSTEVTAMVETCVAQLQEVAEPRTTHRYFPLECTDGEILRFAGIVVKSRDLAKNLQNCHEVCMMAATIGAEVDRLIRQAEIRRMSEAVIYQAAGAALVEEVCDQLNAEIVSAAQARGFACRPRFSPGYGDFSLEHQRDFIRILNTPKILGVCLLDSLLMTPSKSVTAVVGLCRGEASVSQVNHPCERCGCPDCQFRA